MSALFPRSRYAIAILLAPLYCVGATAIAQPMMNPGVAQKPLDGSDSSVIVSDESGSGPMVESLPPGGANTNSDNSGPMNGSPYSYPNDGNCQPEGGYCDGQFCSPDVGPNCEPPKSTPWYFLGEALILDRTNQTGHQVVTELDPSLAPVLRTSDIEFSPEIGPRIAIGYCTKNSTAWEVSYFGLQDWNEQATVTGNNDLNLPGDLGLAANLDFFDADAVTETYSSRIHNVELNHSWSWDETIWMIGFRYFQLNEHFNITSTDVQTGSSEYDIRTHNDLVGLQIGTRINRCTKRFWWDCTAKAGVYGNLADQHQRVDDFAGFVLRNDEADAGHTSFIGDVSLNAAYKVREHVWIRAGYNLMWVQDVALAPNQLDFTDTPTSGTELHAGDGVFYHGVNVGLIVQR
jgi:hypothetical protein